jgi:predicted CoA-substrate-specific enzyme activase
MSFEAAASDARDRALAQAGIGPEHLAATVATGYGRKNAPFADRHRTEIACHARGAYHHHPHACQVVDIGGQDNKVIQLRADGSVEQFQMNRKCAAGTGAFVEEIARRLELDLADLERLAEGADRDITLSSFCTVFSATEVIQLIREGEGPGNICKGIFNAVVARVVEMGQLGKDIVLTGGVAEAFPVVGKILAARTGAEVLVPPHAQFTGALGAALEARRPATA